MTILSRSEIEPAGGVALWRQIADAIRLDIIGGKLESGDKLEGELLLAARFGVNRHTVRRAIAVLIEEGVLRAEHGRGTFVLEARRLSYPIGRRTRFSENLAAQAHGGERLLLSSRIERASARVAARLALKPGTRVLRQETVSFAGGRPLVRATGWLPEARFAGFDAAYLEAGSVTAALKRYGIDDYFRGDHQHLRPPRHHRGSPGAEARAGLDRPRLGRRRRRRRRAPRSTPCSAAFPADRLELVV